MAKKKTKKTSKKPRKENVVQVTFADGKAPTDSDKTKIIELLKDFRVERVQRLKHVFMHGESETACINAEKRLSDLMEIEIGSSVEAVEEIILDKVAIDDAEGAIA